MEAAQIPQPVDFVLSMADMDAKRLRRSMPQVDPVSKVLDDDDLLIEIMVRLSNPISLVHAALVCKHWFCHASDTGFLCRFRKLHPPCLLGFYVDNWSTEAPHFVPMVPQSREPAPVLSHARFAVRNSVMDIRNGTVSTGSYRLGTAANCVSCYPLCPERGMFSVPPFPIHQIQESNIRVVRNLLLNEEGGGFSHCYVLIESNNERKHSTVHVYTLIDGAWRKHISAVAELPCQPKRKPLLVGNRICILALSSDVHVLDLTSLSLSTFQLPQGLIVTGSTKGTMLSRADDNSGVYFMHLNELQLCIWLHKGDKFLLVDTICLREMLDNFRMLDDTLKDKYNSTMRLSQVVDNVEFALLKICRCVLYLDIKCRTLRKVYHMTSDDCLFRRLHPLTTIWPPKFPVPKDDPARFAFWP